MIENEALPLAVDALAADRERVGAAARLVPEPSGNPALDRLAELAARLLAAPCAQISLLTTEQTVAAGTGPRDGAVGGCSPLADSLCAVTAQAVTPLIVTDAGSDGRVSALPPVTSGAVGSYLGVPLRVPGSPPVGALCVFGPQTRDWTAYEVVLLEELAASVLAELELSALTREFESERQRWDFALEAGGVGSFDWDLAADRIDWDERLQAMFGYAPGEYVPSLTEGFARIHPDDRPAVDDAVAAAIASRGDYRTSFRIVLPDGRVRWVAARGLVRTGADGEPRRLLGTAHDVTDARTAEERAAHLLATMATGFLSVDRRWTVTYVNTLGEQVTGMRSDRVLGRSLWEIFPGLEETEFGRAYHHAMDSGRAVQVDAYYQRLDGWFEVRAVPGPDGLAMYFVDITARHAAQERATAAADRAQLLASLSTELAGTVEAEPAVARLAELVVPTLGDWSIVTLTEKDRRLRDIGWSHRDPALRDATREYALHRFTAGGPGAIEEAVESAGPVLITSGATERARGRVTDAAARAALTRLAPESAVVVPLVARGNVLGALSVCRSADRPPMSAEDLDLMTEIAARAAVALDNARLFAQQRTVAEALQRSLLTEPPELDHCRIAVRYTPAAETASVGGDWFDSFRQPDGATMLVIGDVVGHDSEAAAAMGQVRGLLRGIGWFSGAGPADVLAGLDATMQGLQVSTTATAVVARLEESGAGPTRLRWSNAGHPPPYVLHADGTVTVLHGADPNLLLGLDPGTERDDTVVTLEPGSTVLLYTDGLVERRGQGLDHGLALLGESLAGLAGRPLEELCDDLLALMLPDRAEDDVALIAVRLNP